jgi:hypothetical protein
VFTFDHGLTCFYKDGALLAAKTQDLPIPWESIGAANFDGLIDELRVYDRALHAADVLGLYGYDGTPQSQQPLWPTAHTIPGRIEAECFDTGGENVAYHDLDAGNSGGAFRPGEDVDIESTADAGGGHNVCEMLSGEWLEYTVEATSAGSYLVALRIAMDSGECGLNWIAADLDGDSDGMSDADELTIGSDPTNSDEDGNGTLDGLDDWDSDGVSNQCELQNGTAPRADDESPVFSCTAHARRGAGLQCGVLVVLAAFACGVTSRFRRSARGWRWRR